jgi:demethylsterigmatocystin 6-O-methyltransferase
LRPKFKKVDELLIFRLGAKFYYLRAILHDYPEDKCIQILKNIEKAMDKQSRILIDEIVLPDVGVQWQAAGMDLMMMASFGARERTKKMWEILIEGASMKIECVYVYDELLCGSVMVVVPRE